MKRVVLTAIAALVVFSAVAQAEDLFPPVWRTDPKGLAPTTYQRWEFTTGDNPAAPDEFANSFGDPDATTYNVSISFPRETYWMATDIASGRQGVWRINSESDSFISLQIPNNPDENAEKWIWLQVTYSDGIGHQPVLQTEPPSMSIDLVESRPLADGYYHDTFLIVIQPNPVEEVIEIYPRYCNIYIDEIVVDTICIPEPATLALLAAGGVLSVLRRRK